jgi:protein arginine kinase activator
MANKLCQYCSKREAKIHFTEIRDGKKTEMHICQECAQEKKMVMAFPALLTHIVKGAPGILGRGESEAVPAACPSCGLAYAEFKAKGRLGCPTCYDSFAPVLVPLLEKVHGKPSHQGKAPARLQGTLKAKKKLDALEEELAKAVIAEEYEKAAELRDRIRKIKEGELES